MKSANKRNLTLSLPADLIQAAKVLAARQGTSVNELIRQSLEKMVRTENEYATALKRVLEKSERGLYRTKKKRFPRSDLYA